MRTSLLSLDLSALPVAGPMRRNPVPAPAQPEVPPQPTPVPVQASDPAPAESDDDAGDFEIVFGRRQIASTSLVLIVVLVCFSGVSYLIGKAAIASSGPAKPGAPTQLAAEPAAVNAAPTQSKNSPPKDDSPLFAEPIPEKVYIQVGAIDKGLAVIWAEGLRTHGLEAFVSTGPTDQTGRVLIGPLPDPPSYQRAKVTLDNLGIATFGRRYSAEPAPPSTH